MTEEQEDERYEEEMEEDPYDESERLEAESNYRRDNADHEVVSKDELIDRLRDEMYELSTMELEDLADRYFDLNRQRGCTSFLRASFFPVYSLGWNKEMKMKSEKKKAYLDITTETESGYYRHINARVSDETGYCSFWDDRRGFAFRSQTDGDHLKDTNAIKMYGHSLVWNESENNLKNLKDGVKCLQSVQNKLYKMDEKYGDPASFGAWVQRVATALKVDGVKVNGRLCNVAQTAWRVDEIILGWKNEFHPKVEE